MVLGAMIQCSYLFITPPRLIKCELMNNREDKRRGVDGSAGSPPAILGHNFGLKSSLAKLGQTEAYFVVSRSFS